MADILDDWLAEDFGDGDVTSQSVVDNSPCRAEVTGGPGIISGLKICDKLLSKVNVKGDTSFSDGDRIKSDASILSLSGKAYDILRVERLLLNILCHLSGISTFTAKIVELAKSVNPKVEILATRKTVPGLRELEKQAVVHGGGQTHRMRLDDAILIKDNHLQLCKEITKAVERSRMKHPDLMIEVEADNNVQALEAAKSGADRIMLDNFTPEAIEKTALSLRKISDIEIEVSGGITIDNIKAYAPFADFISLGSLTMAAPPIDFSLHVN